MNVNELQEALDALPKKLHDMYGFQIVQDGHNNPAMLRIGRIVSGTTSEFELTSKFKMMQMEKEIIFRNSYQVVFCSTLNYDVCEYRR